MTQKEKTLIYALVAGVLHSVVIPLVLIVLTNIFVKGNFGIVSGIFYIGILSIAYLKSENRDISKKVFFSIVGFISVVTGVYGFIVAIAIYVSTGENAEMLINLF